MYVLKTLQKETVTIYWDGESILMDLALLFLPKLANVSRWRNINIVEEKKKKTQVQYYYLPTKINPTKKQKADDQVQEYNYIRRQYKLGDWWLLF